MSPTAIAIVVGLFLVFLVVKSRVDLQPRRPLDPELRKRIREAKAEALAKADDPHAAAAAWKRAANMALDGGRPLLAARLVGRAQRLIADDVEGVQLAARALRESKRLRSLERFLWMRMSSEDSQVVRAAYDELIDLYAGSMKRPARAAALKKLAPR